jgi:hypothetical protein
MSSTLLSRRCMFFGGLGIVSDAARAEPEPMYLFETRDYQVRVSLEYYDRYRSDGFGFHERMSNRRFCLSPDGHENRECLNGFRGSLAIAHYKLQWHGAAILNPSLRELVRDNDRSESVPARPPYERSIPLEGGLASDIQAFGYAIAPHNALQSESAPDDWWLVRQDLYLDKASTPFVTVHWKHRIDAIRVLDVIPGPGTRQLFGAKRRTAR